MRSTCFGGGSIGDSARPASTRPRVRRAICERRASCCAESPQTAAKPKPVPSLGGKVNRDLARISHAPKRRPTLQPLADLEVPLCRAFVVGAAGIEPATPRV